MFNNSNFTAKERAENRKEIQEINDKQKVTKCKYCERDIKFYAHHFQKDLTGKKILKWKCVNFNGNWLNQYQHRIEEWRTVFLDSDFHVEHKHTCYKEKDYEPKLKVEDMVAVTWPKHVTVYQITEVDKENGFYKLKFKRQDGVTLKQRRPIPIIELDSRIESTDSDGMAEAIFG